MDLIEYLKLSLLGNAVGMIALVGMLVSAVITGLLFSATQKLKDSNRGVATKTFLCLLITAGGWIATGAGIVLFCRNSPFVGNVIRQIFEISWLNFVFIWTMPEKGSRIVIPFLALYLSIAVIQICDFLVPIRGEVLGSITTSSEFVAAVAIVIAGLVSYSQMPKLTRNLTLTDSSPVDQ